ncbi:MAG: squalene/phytoene synthase family protein, partial [Methylocella sp.]
MSGVAGAAEPADASTRARSSSFNAAMRILPRPRREAMFEIYSFCRAVDDIADGAGPLKGRRQALAQWRRDIGALYKGGNEQSSARARLRGLAMAIHAFGLRREDFFAVIDGMEMDVEADIRAPDLATLDLYCDRVASAAGRLSARVFGMPQREGQDLARNLGRALQLTNILRDLDEDAARGRLYLPREDLRAAGIIEAEPRAVLADPALAL